jgi:hypothetical protein
VPDSGATQTGLLDSPHLPIFLLMVNHELFKFPIHLRRDRRGPVLG